MRSLSLLLLALVSAVPAVAHADAQCTPSRLVMVVDRSSSMLGLAGGQTKWASAAAAVADIATRYETKLELGLNVFPNPNQCSAGKTLVKPALNNAAAIKAAIPGPPPSGGNYTPMAQTLDVAAAEPLLADPKHYPSILLVTDGWQWCDPYDAATRTWPLTSVQQAAAKGIKVFIVGFGGAVDVETLNKMAVAAGTAIPGCDPKGTSISSPNKCYYQVDSPMQLNAALDSVSLQVSQEVCDGQDNDCDGQIDEGLSRPCMNACGQGTESCVNGMWTGCTAPQPSAEVCDGADNNCDGTTDEGCTCKTGDQRSCGGGVGACLQKGTQRCLPTGKWSECVGAGTPKPETCDGIDNDCDGDVDNGATSDLCPAGMLCENGTCVMDTPPSGPATPPDEAIGAGEDGCGCAVGGAARQSTGTLALLSLLALGGLLLRRRRA